MKNGQVLKFKLKYALKIQNHKRFARKSQPSFKYSIKSLLNETMQRKQITELICNDFFIIEQKERLHEKRGQ